MAARVWTTHKPTHWATHLFREENNPNMQFPSLKLQESREGLVFQNLKGDFLSTISFFYFGI